MEKLRKENWKPKTLFDRIWAFLRGYKRKKSINDYEKTPKTRWFEKEKKVSFESEEGVEHKAQKSSKMHLDKKEAQAHKAKTARKSILPFSKRRARQAGQKAPSKEAKVVSKSKRFRKK